MDERLNHRRMLAPSGNIPPAEAEARYHASLDQPVLAAWLKPHSLRSSWARSWLRLCFIRTDVVGRFWRVGRADLVAFYCTLL